LKRGYACIQEVLNRGIRDFGGETAMWAFTVLDERPPLIAAAWDMNQWVGLD